MQHKRLVIDANILIRAVFGQRVRELIANASDPNVKVSRMRRRKPTVLDIQRFSQPSGLFDDGVAWRVCRCRHCFPSISVPGMDCLRKASRSITGPMTTSITRNWISSAVAINASA